ncbi:unnamed protein product [Protopolystoma xenopodis]|uniref:Uncharacterized protein n=1 Tax=Protopolystoma xenopodis TaxID=117903 RepID=A0A3S5C5T5_9PLAT|nr:unnamed protein product [Protopolystoma xenopodis]
MANATRAASLSGLTSPPDPSSINVHPHSHPVHGSTSAGGSWQQGHASMTSAGSASLTMARSRPQASTPMGSGNQGAAGGSGQRTVEQDGETTGKSGR